MKKVVALLILVIFCITLIGCDKGRKASRVESYGVSPEMTIYAKDAEPNSFYYVVEEHTGIVYIVCERIYGTGITVAFNSDGSIMTSDDLRKRMGSEHERR